MMAAADDEEEILLLLFDSCWFEHDILRSRPCVSSSFAKPVLDQQEHLEIEEANLPEISIFRVRSQSEKCLRSNTCFSPDAASPKSVISTPRLEKKLSREEDSSFLQEIEEQSTIETAMKKKVSHGRRRERSKKGMKGISRSLPELEYEELKGFMELGFVFTEEDKTSNLVAILPGLQRWGTNDCDEAATNEDRCKVSRPYLSEAWEVLNQRKVYKPQVNLKFPPAYNETNMKDQLKAWAHTVASSVR